MALPILGIIVSLALLIFLAYRGHSVIWVAPLAALVGAAFSGAPLLATYTQVFMPRLGSFIIAFFPLFIAGAIFGRLMTITGYATALAHGVTRVFGAERAILATYLTTALLAYGGISAWVVVFTIYPIAQALFREAGVPKRLMPAAIMAGIGTFAIAALPGSPQVHNAIPTRYFGTDTFAAPWAGLLGAAITFGLGMLWLTYRKRQLVARGETYDSTVDPEGRRKAEAAALDTADLAEVADAQAGDGPARPLVGLLPLLAVFVTNYLFIFVIAPRLDTSYLAEDRFGATTLQSVVGIWSVTIALVTAIVVIFLMRPWNFRRHVEALSAGAKTAVLPAFATASEVGYGAVIASLAVFASIRGAIFEVSDNALVISAATTGLIAGITGSASGGLTIALSTFGDQLSAMAAEQGISLELMHRVSAMASVSFDSLPHNGAVITVLLVCGLTHRDSYKDIGAVTVVIPAIGAAAVIALAVLVPGFG